MMFDEIKDFCTTLHRGAFLSSGDNVMIIGWGMVGVMWSKRVFAVPVRESRYTKSFIDKTQTFTVSIPCENEMTDAIKFCGTKSGRDYDKWAVCNLQKQPAKAVDGFVVGGCCKYYECKVIGQFEMKDMDMQHVAKLYPVKEDIHTLYIGEIVEEY